MYPSSKKVYPKFFADVLHINVFEILTRVNNQLFPKVIIV